MIYTKKHERYFYRPCFFLHYSLKFTFEVLVHKLGRILA